MRTNSGGTSIRTVIPSLDGLRAFAVLSVILFHLESLDGIGWLLPFRNGSLGVTCFFVISGMLITRLLLDELDEGGRIDLKRFYLRRSFRIFPAFYAYLAVVGLLALLHVAPIDRKSFLVSATYLRNYFPHPTAALLEHTWSLSLEEQFYLFWPACLFYFSPRTCLRLAGLAVVLSPLSRVLTHALLPGMRDHINFMLHTRLDSMMVGAFLSLSAHQHVFSRVRDALKRPLWLLPVALYFLAEPTLEAHLRGTFTLTAGFTLDALGCGIVILYATSAPASLLGRLLNLRWIRHLGVIS